MRLGFHRGKYVAVVGSGPNRRRFSLGTDQREAAERRLAALAARPPDVVTVAEVWRRYVDDNAGKAVIETMRHTWKAIEPSFGSLEPQHITTAICRAHTERRSRTVKAGTINTELGHLSTVLNWGERHGLIGSDAFTFDALAVGTQ